MIIKDSIMVGARTTDELYTAKARAKENRLATGQKASESTYDDAAALRISTKPSDAEEAVNENAKAAASTFTDVFKAEEMIREANKRIMEQTDDAVLAQANQLATVATELLK